MQKPNGLMLGSLMDVFTIEAKRRLGLGVIVKSWIEIKVAVYATFIRDVFCMDVSAYT